MDYQDWKTIAQQYRKERDEALSMLGAVVYSQGGEVIVNNECFITRYSIKSHQDCVTLRTIIRVTMT